MKCDDGFAQKTVEAEEVGDGVCLMAGEVVDSIADYDVAEPIFPFAEWLFQPTLVIVKPIFP